MLNEEFDPYEHLILNAQHIEQLAQFCREQSQLIQQLVEKHNNLTSMLIDVNTRLNAAEHRISRLERQNAVIIPSTNHSQ